MITKYSYAPGAVGIFHIRHLNILQKTRSRIDYLIAGVVSDEKCELSKRNRRSAALAEELEIVESSRCGDRAVAEVLPDEMDAGRKMSFDVLARGGEWQGTRKGVVLKRVFTEVTVQVVYCRYRVHTSNTLSRGNLQAEQPAVVSEGSGHGNSSKYAVVAGADIPAVWS
ncbi:adenylyltransferase/cytidyltransferase family protein [Arthrobacter sp. 179]|uniref:adenylyltransferase/cytidyltransferase family protein n=1 Tax=Arthrobacter sp. 179 TaxID=3457734 RepID=UPI0040341734